MWRSRAPSRPARGLGGAQRPAPARAPRRAAQPLAQYGAALRTVALAARPGERHSYCSGNYNLLGRIIETVSGRPFGEYAEREIFAPLGRRRRLTNERRR